MNARRKPQAGTRAGWTLIEVTLAGMLMVVVLGKGVFVMQSALTLANSETSSMHYEDQARRVMDRIGLSLMGSDRDSLLPQVESLHSDSIRYTVSLGIEDGEVVWSAPQEIALAASGTEVEWRESPGEADERRAVWTDLVAPLLQGEVENGIDDNGNGLIDEDGLSFVLEGDRVTIRLTIRRPEVGGRMVEQTVESIVCCRN
jgi:type II secretory pathway pseudopilin PulG